MTTNNYFRAAPDGRATYREARVLPESAEDGPPPADRMERILFHAPRPIDWTRVHFFDDRNPASTLVAWERAKKSGGEVAVYRNGTLLPSGPWVGILAIGETPPDLAGDAEPPTEAN